MKILITTQYFYPEDFRINDFAFKMAKRGHKVSVITAVPNYPSGKFHDGYKSFSKEIIEDVTIYRVPIFPRGKSRGIELVINYLSFLFSALIFGPFLIRKIKADVVFSINYSPATVGLVGIFFSKIKKAPLFIWVQDLWPDSLIAANAVKSNTIIQLVQSMVKWIYKKSNIIFIQSESFRRSIESLDFSFSKKIRYLPNWAEDIYTSEFILPDDKHSKLIPNDKFIFMFAGNLGVAQSLNTIILAAKELKNEPIHWIFLGDGRKKEWLANAVTKYGLEDHISILGRYPIEDMPSFFRLANVMLVTLKKEEVYSLTIPGKIQSYLKNAKPILSALDGEGAKVINESGSGKNVNSEDFLSLAEAALEMSNSSSDKLYQMSKNGMNYYMKNFDVETALSKFENEYEIECTKKNSDI